jgi:predicted P-loop ATPase
MTKSAYGTVKAVRNLTIRGDNHFDVEAAERMVEAIMGDRNAVVNLRAIPESKEANARLAALPPEERNRKRFNFTGTLSDFAELLINKNKSGHAIFFAVNETDGQGHKKANFIAGRVLVLDLDGTPLPDRWMVEPHWVIETSPGRFQCFFVIERTSDIDAVEDASRRMAAFYGGDPNVCDISHIFRLAGFFHQKRDRFRVRPVLENDFNPPSKLSDFDFLPALPAPESATVNSGVGNLDDGKAAILFAELDATAFGSNANWLKLAMSVHAASGGDPDVGDRLFDWSATDPRYGDDGAQILNRARWNSFRLDKSSLIGVGTLVKLCQEHGVQESTLRKVFNTAAADFEGEQVDTEEDGASSGKKEVRPIERRGIKVNNNSKAEDTYSNAFIAVLQCGLDPAWDEMSQTVVFRNAPWNASHGYTFNDHTHRIVRLFLSNTYQGNAYEPGEKHVFDAVMAVAYQNKFNPVIDYLAGLTWDGVPRLDRLFVNYIRCGDSPYTRAVSACFGIGAVRRMRQPGCKLDTMPVVKGPQGWGKSTGVQALFGRQWFSDADMGSLKDKDAAMKLRGMWGVEFAEIDSLTKAATGDLKAFLSRATDRQRDPYGRIVEDHPRRCVFIGTVNEGGYLKDSTGARRFWPLELGDRVDVARIEADRNQLWAEAATREEAGESYVLPQALWSVAAEEQARQTTDDPWVDVLRSFLAARAREWDAGEFEHFADPTDQPRPPDRVFTSELFDALHIVTEHRTKGQSQRLRTVMESALGWKHRDNLHWRGEQGKGYTRTLQGHGDTY